MTTLTKIKQEGKKKHCRPRGSVLSLVIVFFFSLFFPSLHGALFLVLAPSEGGERGAPAKLVSEHFSGNSDEGAQAFRSR